MSDTVKKIVVFVVLITLLIGVILITFMPIVTREGNTSIEFSANQLQVNEYTYDEADFFSQSDITFVVDKKIDNENFDGYIIFTAFPFQYSDNPITNLIQEVNAFNPLLCLVFYTRLNYYNPSINEGDIITASQTINALINRPIILRNSNFIKGVVLPNSFNGRFHSDHYADVVKGSQFLANYYLENGDFDIFTSFTLSDDFYGTIRQLEYNENYETAEITDLETYVIDIPMTFSNVMKESLSNLYYNLKYLRYPTFDFEYNDITDIFTFFKALFNFGDECVTFVYSIVSSFFASFYPIFALR